MEERELQVTVNGEARALACDPDSPLLDVLRAGLGLAGPRFGCGLGLCGACMVIIDGKARSSCDVPASAAEGASVTTVEGLGQGGALHAVQRAFLDEQAAQCGYCISGMLVAAAALLAANPAPAEQEVRAALDGNLCRCGAHRRLVAAVLKAAQYDTGQSDIERPGRDRAAPRDAGQCDIGQSDIGQPGAPHGAGRPMTTTRSGNAARPGGGSPPPLPASLAANPALKSWLAFAPGGTVTIFTGKVEYGQGIWTALAQIAAEELDVALARVTVAPVSTGTSPDEGVTSGSLSIQHSGSALRQACAQARAALLAAAAGKLGISVSALTVDDGQIAAAGQPTGLTYWSLAGPGLLDREAGAPVPVKPPDRWSVAGRSAARLDLPDKVAGRPRFLHDLVLPGMLHGRVVRPPAVVAELLSTGDPALPPDVHAVRDGSFLGVVAPADAAALRAARLLAQAARWDVTESLPDDGDLKSFLLSAPAEAVPVESRPDAAAASAATLTRTAEYTRPFLAHASMAPSCAIARWDGGAVTVWSHSQGVFPLRDAIAAGLGLDAAQVTVHHAEGAGAYGHNGADDAALDAVLLARAVPGRPVRVLWTREDEMGWAPLGPAMLARLSAGLDAHGKIVTWRQDVWSNGFIGRPGSGGEPRLLALAHLAG